MFYTISSIAPICTQLHASGRKLVLATGFFDLLHSEHINFLCKAKEQGDILIVAVESDERARILKGDGRPAETQSLRCDHLLAFCSRGSELQAVCSTAKDSSEPCIPVVDYVLALPPDFDHFEAYDSLMSAIRPQVYAVSSHTNHIKSKAFLVEKYGGHLVVVHDWNPSTSTTKILETKNNI